VQLFGPGSSGSQSSVSEDTSDSPVSKNTWVPSVDAPPNQAQWSSLLPPAGPIES
jgi:hypothetical protein